MNIHKQAFSFAAVLMVAMLVIGGILAGLTFGSVWLLGVPWPGLCLGVTCLLVLTGYAEATQ